MPIERIESIAASPKELFGRDVTNRALPPKLQIEAATLASAPAYETSINRDCLIRILSGVAIRPIISPKVIICFIIFPN